MSSRVQEFKSSRYRYVLDVDAGAAKEFYSVFETVVLAVDDSFDSCLDNELGTFKTWCGGDVEGGSIAGIA